MPTDPRALKPHEHVGSNQPTAPRSRRALLTAAAAAGGALATHALVRPSPVAAAGVVLGAVNTAAAATTIRSTQALNSAKALVGLVTYAGAGGSTAGVQGQSNALHGNGVFGYAPTGNSKGVWGRSLSGTGVYGEATATTGINFGVRGITPSTSGVGVQGIATHTSGDTFGVSGSAASPHGRGVYGVNNAANGTGVFGLANTGPNARGVSGRTVNGRGVYGQADGPDGVGVMGTGALGVYGSGDTGVHGDAVTHGVVGDGKYGVYGRSFDPLGAGVFGEGPQAGYFVGNVFVEGELGKSGGSFVIDHPQDPANKTLEHSFVEAPERLNIYRGNVTLDTAGRATVRMPPYFRALNADYSYQLTAVGAPAPSLHVARKLNARSFAIAGGTPGQEVCWQVTGVRRDAWATKHPLRVERTKRRKDRGKYLNPDAFGKPRSAAMHPPPKAR